MLCNHGKGKSVADKLLSREEKIFLACVAGDQASELLLKLGLIFLEFLNLLLQFSFFADS